MSRDLFKQQSSIERLQSNPLAAHLDSFAASLAEESYAVATVRSKLLWVTQLGWWLQERKLTVAQLDERIVDVFLQERRCCLSGYFTGNFSRSFTVDVLPLPALNGPVG